MWVFSLVLFYLKVFYDKVSKDIDILKYSELQKILTIDFKCSKIEGLCAQNLTHMQTALGRKDRRLAEASSHYSAVPISQFYTNLTVFISKKVTSRNMYTIIGDSSTLSILNCTGRGCMHKCIFGEDLWMLLSSSHNGLTGVSIYEKASFSRWHIRDMQEGDADG